MTAPAHARTRLAPYRQAARDRSRTMVTPEGIALPFAVASRGARAGALILDFVILYVGGSIALLLLAWLAISVFDVGEVGAGVGEFLVVALFLFLFLARYGYFLFFELGPRGATPGKRATGIRVAARDGGRLTAEAVIARNLVRDIEIVLPLAFIPAAPEGEGGLAGIAAALWVLTFVLIPFLNRDRLRAGDIIAGTWVVDAPRAKLREAISTEGAASGISVTTGARYSFSEEDLSHYGEYEVQTLERVLRDGQPDTLRAVAETICGKIGWNLGEGDERDFLEAFYAQLRARLEGAMRMGRRRATKFD